MVIRLTRYTAQTKKKKHPTKQRSAFQYDFAARMQWTLSPEYTTERHPPIIDINGHSGLEPLIMHVKSNQTLIFDASGTVDADAHRHNHNHSQDALRFEWFQYQEASYLPAPPALEGERLVIQPVQQQKPQQGQQDEVLQFNEQGFRDVVRAQKVRVRVPAKQTVSVIGGYHLILQVITVGGEFPITRYKRVVLVPWSLFWIVSYMGFTTDESDPSQYSQ